MDKKKILICCIAMAVLLALAMVWFFVSQYGGKTQPADASVTAVLPDGEVRQMADRKSDAFRGAVSTDAYFEMLGEQMDAEGELSLVSDSLRAKRPAAPAKEPEGSAVDRVFGPAPSSSGEERSGGPRRSYGGGSTRTMTQEEQLEYERRRAEMVRDVLNGAQEGMPDQVGHDGRGAGHDCPRERDEPASIDLSSVGGSDGIITMLDDDVEDAAVQYEGAKRPFRCMFVQDQKLKSGQRVTLRLLEDYVDGGVRIPANTHLAAICKIGDRLEMQVRSLEMNGRIISLALDAFDTDGLQGLYCPETSASKNSRKAANDAISTAGTTFGGLVGDIASTVIRTGASIARSASGEVSVSVVNGYEFYLVKSEKR